MHAIMTPDSPSLLDPVQSPARNQFSLRVALVCMLVLSVVLATALQFPRQAGFAYLMTLLMLLPFAIVAVLRMPFVRLGIISRGVGHKETTTEHGLFLSTLRRLARAVGLLDCRGTPSLAAGLITALISSVVIVGLWRVIREIGLWMSVFTFSSEYRTWEYAEFIVQALVESNYWVVIWKWEMWSLGRWWLLFGAIALVWLAVSLPFHRSQLVSHITHTLARLLAFAPWLIFLEVAFLIGVWIESPDTVPEPSTGFVVGIFSWDLWHWDCWLDRGWLIRGALPTFVAGVMFFTSVLRWGRVASVIAAIILIPISLMLSVACTVAFQNGL